MAEAFIFGYIGIQSLGLMKGEIVAVTDEETGVVTEEKVGWDVAFTLWCVMITLMGRALQVFVCTVLLKMFLNAFTMTPKRLGVLWFTGVIRGPITYALVLNIAASGL